MPRLVLLTAALASVSALVLGCGSPTAGPVTARIAGAPVGAPIAAVAAAEPCADGKSPVASLAPVAITTDPDSMTGSRTLATIRKNGRSLRWPRAPSRPTRTR